MGCNSWILKRRCTAYLCEDKDRFQWISDSIGGKLNLAMLTNVEGKKVTRVYAANNQGDKLTSDGYFYIEKRWM